VVDGAMGDSDVDGVEGGRFVGVSAREDCRFVGHEEDGDVEAREDGILGLESTESSILKVDMLFIGAIRIASYCDREWLTLHIPQAPS
jgi:hypothetical protein